MLHVRIAVRSDVGAVRRNNEDAVLLADPICGETGPPVAAHTHAIGPCVLVAGVFDGMGGAAAGEIASALAAEIVLCDLVDEQVPTEIDLIGERLARSLHHASAVIHDEGRRDPSCRGMGTTGTVGAFTDGSLVVAHVGDSRVYLVRRDTIGQVTRDDSLVARLVEQGSLAFDDIEAFPYSHVLLQALGASPSVDVSVQSVRLCADDRILFCTDGLTNALPDDMIADVLVNAQSPAAACDALVALARGRVCTDNVTVAVGFVDP